MSGRCRGSATLALGSSRSSSSRVVCQVVSLLYCGFLVNVFAISVLTGIWVHGSGGLIFRPGGAFVVPLIIGCKRVKPYAWRCSLGFKDGISFHDVGPCGLVSWSVLRRGGFGLQYHFADLVIKVWPIVAGVFLAETFWFCCKKASAITTNYRSISWVPKTGSFFREVIFWVKLPWTLHVVF